MEEDGRGDDVGGRVEDEDDYMDEVDSDDVQYPFMKPRRPIQAPLCSLCAWSVTRRATWVKGRPCVWEGFVYSWTVSRCNKEARLKIENTCDRCQSNLERCLRGER